MKKYILKIVTAILAAIMLLTMGIGCSGRDDGKLTVICTVFPIYDWVRNIVGDNKNVEVKLLVDNGTDLHSFQPTADDIIDIRNAELIIRVGGESDSFMNSIAKSREEGSDLKLMEAEGVVLRNVSKESEHDGHEKNEIDEHMWLSLKNAIASADAICEAISALDPSGADEYRKNADEYKAKLGTLDLKYRSAVLEAESPRLVVADRFPFVYLTEDYGIEYYAAFEGCTTEAEASFETVIKMSDKLKEWDLSYVAVTESSDKALANRVIETSGLKNVKIAVFDSMQSVTEKDISEGATYLDITENNFAVLLDLLTAGRS